MMGRPKNKLTIVESGTMPGVMKYEAAEEAGTGNLWLRLTPSKFGDEDAEDGSGDGDGEGDEGESGGVPGGDEPISDDDEGTSISDWENDTTPEYVEPEIPDQPELAKDGTPVETKRSDKPIAGKGTGEEVEPAKANPEAYYEMRKHLLGQIRKMLTILRLDTKPKFTKEQFKPTGRMMGSQLTRAFIMSKKVPVMNIYAKNRMDQVRKEAMLCLLVDVSGSTDERAMKRTLLTIGEVAAAWMPDNQFAIFQFGAGFQRIKSFEESYRHTRYRVAGQLGSIRYATELVVPLKRIEKMFDKYKKVPARKLLIIVSDFILWNPVDNLQPYKWVQERIQILKQKYGIITILIANAELQGTAKSARQMEVVDMARRIQGTLSGGVWRHVGAGTHKFPDTELKRPCCYVVNMPSFASLPDHFIKVYEDIANEAKLPPMTQAQKSADYSKRLLP